jgi:hypothetical protein
MKRIRSCAIVLLGAGLLAGCSLEGHWVTTKVEPADMSGHFQFASVNFNSDGTYTGKATYEGKERTVTGTYEWNGSTLTVTPREGHPRTYRGTLWWGKKLTLEADYKGNTVKGNMEKQSGDVQPAPETKETPRGTPAPAPRSAAPQPAPRAGETQPKTQH